MPLPPSDTPITGISLPALPSSCAAAFGLMVGMAVDPAVLHSLCFAGCQRRSLKEERFSGSVAIKFSTCIRYPISRTQ